MPTIQIRGENVDVDVEAELRQFEWTQARWQSDKLLTASPFRYDKSPSFFVRLEQYGDYPAGTWGDSGAYDAEWASGGLVKLLAFLRNETYEEAEDYLADQYGVPASADELRLKPLRLVTQQSRRQLRESALQGAATPSDYLLGRGISAATQAYYGVQDMPRAVELPWRGANGRLANVKYRSKHGKTFWYVRGGDPIRNLLWGVDKIVSNRASVAVLAEAEIDAMSWREATGLEAVACGGAEWSWAKRDLVLRSGLERLLIATDNDKAGEKLRRAVESSLLGKVAIEHVRIGGGAKDANEALIKQGPAELRRAIELSQEVRTITKLRLR